MEEIFHTTGQVSVPTSNLFEEFMMLFDEPENAILSEAKAADNKVDNLKFLIDEVAKYLESEPQVQSEPPVQRKPQSSSETIPKLSSFQGRDHLCQSYLICHSRGRTHLQQ